MASSRRGGIRLSFTWLVFIMAVALPVWFAVSALGVKYGFWDYTVGLGTLTRDWGGKFVMLVLALGVLTLILGLLKAPRVRIVILSCLILLIGVLAFGRLVAMRSLSASLPPIHDIQTDWSDPIELSPALMDLRGPDSNVVVDDPKITERLAAMEAGFYAQKAEAQKDATQQFIWNLQVLVGLQSEEFMWKGLAGNRVADEQANAYPEIEPLFVSDSPLDAFQRAEEVIASMGMEFVTRNQSEGVIEAVAETQWFGFKDDVAIRILPVGEGSRIDVRSVSRVGLSDLGANAKRVSLILDSLKQKLTIVPADTLVVETAEPVPTVVEDSATGSDEETDSPNDELISEPVVTDEQASEDEPEEVETP